MSRELMIVLIVAIVMFASVMRSRYGQQRRRDRSVEGRPSEAENQRLRDEVKQLRDRIAVLERITVEKENSLEREIEALRDERS